MKQVWIVVWLLLSFVHLKAQSLPNDSDFPCSKKRASADWKQSTAHMPELVIISSIMLSEGDIEIRGRIKNPPPQFDYQRLKIDFGENIELLSSIQVQSLPDNYFFIYISHEKYKYTQTYYDILLPYNYELPDDPVLLEKVLDQLQIKSRVALPKDISVALPQKSEINLYYSGYSQSYLDSLERRLSILDRDIQILMNKTELIYPQRIKHNPLIQFPVKVQTQSEEFIPLPTNNIRLPLAEKDDVPVSRLNTQLMRIAQLNLQIENKLQWIQSSNKKISGHRSYWQFPRQNQSFEDLNSEENSTAMPSIRAWHRGAVWGRL